MLHTMRGAIEQARKAGREPAAILAGATHGALMGARGNSGVLLSQVIRGVKDAWDPDGVDMKKAFALARTYAFAAVAKPANGTMLTALKEMEDAVRHDKGDAERLLGAAVDRGRAAVDRTREENPVNKAAGVVDALDAMSAEHEARTGIVVSRPAQETPALAVVAVVPGDGLGRIATSLGAHVVRCGATMNPSTQELVDAMKGTNASHVVMLPNDKNVILAAEQAAALAAPLAVTVVPARNVAQGMAALAAWDQAETPDEAIAAMRDAAERAHAIEITVAIRDAEVDGEPVRKGEHLALLDGTIVAHSPDELTALATAAKALSETGLFTLYVGAGVDAARRDAAAGRLRTALPGAEVEVVDGGQPHYPFIVAAE